MAPAELLAVELVWSPQAGDVRRCLLHLPAGTTLEQALRGCPEFADQMGGLADLKLGIWGRLRPLETLLRDRDRIEVYRPLTVDPKEARRQRYRDRGERIVSRHRPLAGKSGR
jgi:putative ubiquitin-RnfH superfamily antitoxin RatB of RatAB toxin-antitoxin module